MTPPLVCLHNPICEQCLKLEVHLVLYCRGTHTHTCLVINVIVNQNLSVWLYSVHLHYMRAWWNDRLLIDLRNLPAPLPAVNNEYASTHTHTHIFVSSCVWVITNVRSTYCSNVTHGQLQMETPACTPYVFEALLFIQCARLSWP